jgi:AraC family transcriptional regulator of adaptative response/methylated-DNA-[protein]-cysteine methyltransferase
MPDRKSDYDRIATAISFIAEQADTQPNLEAVAKRVHMSPYHFQRLFSRWVGVTPKKFLQVLTLERAKKLLRESHPLLEVSETVGLSSSSRLYDHFVRLEAVTPGEFKNGGAGLTIQYAEHRTPFGPVFIAVTPRGICKLSFLADDGPLPHLDDLQKKWPGAEISVGRGETQKAIDAMFGATTNGDRTLSLHVTGTNFQVSVWRALLQIQPASVASYAQVAAAIGQPAAVRAVGRAVGANPVAYLIPCHRVIRQSGELGGYHWGVTRKLAIHAWETARHPASR